MLKRKNAEKRQYYLHFIQMREVPLSDQEVVIKWKRGKKEQNKGYLQQLKCIDGIIDGNQNNVIMALCTLFKTSKGGYEEKLMKFSLLLPVEQTGKKKSKKPKVIATGYINLAEYIDCQVKRNVTIKMKGKEKKKGKERYFFEYDVDVMCTAGVEVSDYEGTENIERSENFNPFDEDMDISEDASDNPLHTSMKKSKKDKEKKDKEKKEKHKKDDDSKSKKTVVVAGRPRGGNVSSNPFGGDDENEPPAGASLGGRPRGGNVSSNPFESTKESNPFGDDSSEDSMKGKKSDNPFGDSSSEDSRKKNSHTPNPFESPRERDNANPFGDEDDNNNNPFGNDDTKQNKSSNPFGDYDDDSDEQPNINPFGDYSEESGADDPVLVGFKRGRSNENSEDDREYNANIFESTRMRELEKPQELTDDMIQYKKTPGVIDLREVIDSTKDLKGQLNDIDTFIILLKKWWGDGKPHFELNLLPLIMETYIDCIWLLITLKDVGGKVKKQNAKMTQRDLQINEVYENTYIKAVKLISNKYESLLDYLVDINNFDSRRSEYEEGVALSCMELMNDIYQITNKYDSSICDRFMKQICHFISYYIIEEMLSRNKVNATKAFQLMYFISCVEGTISKHYKHLKIYVKCLDPLMEVCRLMSFPMSVDIIMLKDEIFPSIGSSLILKILNAFKIDGYNLTKIPKDVFDWLFEHNDNQYIPSRFTILK